MSETKVVAGASIRSPLDDIKDRAPDYRGLLDEIESVFELRSIRSFSDFRTLLRSIRDAAASGMQLGWPPDTDWPWILNQARGLLCLIDEDTTARFAKAAGYGRTGQKLADITEHGLLETFLQRVDTAALSPGTDIAAPLKAILYGATKILQSRSDAKALLDEAVTAVRTMCLTSSRDTNLLAALAVSPGTPLKIDDYRRAVGTLITHQGVTEHQRRKLKRILALLDLLLTASPLPVAGSPVRAPKPRDWAATRPKSISVRVGSDALQEIGLITDSDLSSQPALPSMTELLVLSLRDTVGTPTIGEKELDLAGETPDVLVATVSSEADHDTDDEAHDDALKASLAEGNSKESRYWLQKAELVTRFAPQC